MGSRWHYRIAGAVFSDCVPAHADRIEQHQFVEVQRRYLQEQKLRVGFSFLRWPAERISGSCTISSSWSEVRHAVKLVDVVLQFLVLILERLDDIVL